MKIRRGDSKLIKFRRVDQDGNVLTSLPLAMYFTVKDKPNGRLLFQKTLEKGITFNNETFYYTVEILPSDTENLEFGRYGFDIEVVTENDLIHTICVSYLDVLIDYTEPGDR